MAFQINIATKNMDITDRLNEYISKKVTKLDRFLNDIDETRVDLAFVKSARSASDRFVAQITIHGKGYILRAEERSDDIFTAVDTSLDKIQRQIERFKGKRQRGRGGEPLSEAMAEPIATETEQRPVIARRKEFALIPMDEIEALEQMTLLGHENFFIFYNINTNNINVLYRRRDGTYGLIEPKLR